jgi:hypothetical protein
VIKRINELLKPSGIFLSATDCFSEKPSMMNRLQLLLAKLRLLPYINSLSTSCLEQLIVQNNFEVRDSATLYPKPLNFFLAAQKLPV